MAEGNLTPPEGTKFYMNTGSVPDSEFGRRWDKAFGAEPASEPAKPQTDQEKQFMDHFGDKQNLQNELNDPQKINSENVANATSVLENANKVRETINGISVDVPVPELVIPGEQKTAPEAAEPTASVSEAPTPTSLSEQKAKEAWGAAARMGQTISKGDPMDLKARELRDAWDTATYSGIGKVVDSGDLLARMEKEGQLIDHSKVASTEAKPAGSAAPAPATPENPAAVPPVTPESPVVPPTTTAETPTVETTGEVPLNPVKTTEQKQAEADAEREAKMKEALDDKTKGKTELDEEAVKPDDMAQIEKELEDKMNAARGSGGEALTEGQKRAFARDFWMGKLGEHSLMYSIQHQPGFKGEIGRFFAFVSGNRERVGIVKKNEQGLMEAVTKDGKPLEFDINWMLQHPGQDLVDFLKSEYATQVKGKTGEVVSTPAAEVPAPAATEAPSKSQVEPGSKAATTESADTTVKTENVAKPPTQEVASDKTARETTYEAANNDHEKALQELQEAFFNTSAGKTLSETLRKLNEDMSKAQEAFLLTDEGKKLMAKVDGLQALKNQAESASKQEKPAANNT